MTVHPTAAEVEAALAELATTPPDHLSDSILVATGLADQMTVVQGPLGPLCVVFGERGVTGCAPLERWHDYLERHGARTVVEVAALPAPLASEVEQTLATGKLGRLPVDLDELTEFQQAVLRKAAEIPPGETRSYGWIAKEIGRPGAVRAVGSALNRNPVPVLIPCHRVGKSDGHLGDYAYGQGMKRDLLRAEGLDPEAVEALAERGVRFVGSRNGTEFCHPTCRYAKRIREENRIEFRSQDAAEAAGYRPCKVCRPVALAG